MTDENSADPVVVNPVGVLSLTKREYFAAMVLCGQLSHPQNECDPIKNANWAVTTADALLSALAVKS